MLQGVLVLLVLSIFFAYLIAPLVEFFHRPLLIGGRERLMPRVGAIALVYVLIFGTLGLTVYLLLPQIGDQFTELGKQAPGYYQGLRKQVESLNRLYERLPAPARGSVKETIGQTVTTLGDYIQATAVSTATFTLTHAPWLVLIPILAFFLLKDADSFRRSALKMLPRGRLRWRGDEFFQDVNSTLAAYIRAQLIACLLIGVVCTVGFYLLGVPYALVLGIAAGVFEFIPLAGPLAIGIIATVVAGFHSPGTAIACGLFLLVLRIVHDYASSAAASTSTRSP
jgi:predicted PurR-regulated permease PerM